MNPIATSQTKKDFQQKQLTRWMHIQQALFNSNIPADASWTKRDDIIDVLNAIVQPDKSTIVLYPVPGKNGSLKGATICYEPGCIELTLGMCSIVKPAELHFCSFPKPEWNFFWLHTEAIAPSGAYPGRYYKQLGNDGEHLIELNPLEYYTPEAAEQKEPGTVKRQREVKRYLAGGDFFICSKASVYSGRFDVDDIFSTLGFVKFRAVIEKALEGSSQKNL